MKNKVREYAKQLRAAGHECTSNWLKERLNPKADIEPGDNFRHQAERDLIDIDRSHQFVLFTVNPKHWIKRGGKHFEAGYAYANGLTINVIGPNENIFYFLRDVKHFKSFKEFLGSLEV